MALGYPSQPVLGGRWSNIGYGNDGQGKTFDRVSRLDSGILATSPLSPYRPRWGGWLSGVGFVVGAGLGVVVGRRGLQRLLRKTANATAELPKAAAQVATSVARKAGQSGGKVTPHQHTFSLYRNVDSPLLSMAFLATEPGMKGVLAWFGVASALGFLGGNALKGVKETWVRAEETAIRMQAMDSMVATYRDSVRDRNRFLTALKQRTWHTLRQWLQEGGVDIKQLTLTSPLAIATALEGRRPAVSPGQFAQGGRYGVGGNSQGADQAANQAAKFHTNYLLEPRQRPMLVTNFGDGRYGGGQLSQSTDRKVAGVGDFPPPLTPLSAQQWWPWLAGGAGFAVGAVLSGVQTTAKQLGNLVGRTHQQTATKETITGLFVKNTETLAILAKQLEAPALLLAYGVAVGVITAAKHMVEGIREIVVTEENTQTELAYQRYKWQQLGSRLMAVAETEWVANQLQVFAQGLAGLGRIQNDGEKTQIASQWVGVILNGIGFNSAPPHYNTPLELNITEARS